MMTRASSARALFARAAFTLFAAIVFLSTIPAPTLGQSSSQPWNNPSQFVLGNNNFSITSSPATRYYEWTVSQQNIAPDGLERPMLLVNGMFPGPLVEANTGDRIVVKVTNNMTNGTSIHWHGMFQNGTNWMDGTTSVTQCPIPPGQSFTYNFTVPNQWGTYWWHAHTGSQYVDGVVGPLIIHSPDEPHLHEYDSDIIVMLSDFYHTPSEPLITWYLTSASEGVEPVPDNGLINGRNSFNCTNDAQAQFPTGSKNCSSNAPLSVFEFKQGLKYRIRLINSGNFADFQFSIDNHTLSVIEADGVDMQPVDVQRIPIHVAQRYSAIVQANQAVQSYWMRATMNTNCFNVVNPALNSSVTAIVHYDGAPDPGQQQPSSLDWGSKPWAGKCLDLTEAMLKPVLAKDAPEADVQIILDMSFQTITKNNVNLGYVNSTSWVPLKKAATLFQANKGVSKFAKSQMVITLNQTQTIELIVNNYDEGSHPFHLHGHQFYVLGAGDGSYLPGRSAINTTNPLRRDTVTLQTFGYTVLRFVSDNPGMWAFHCHIDWHMQAGLMMQFLSLPSVVEAFDIPKELKAMCGKA
ncbi:multi-copper oxidase [Dissophora ornata]|nr:multi-copper oxidase [Dissophora ornata]